MLAMHKNAWMPAILAILVAACGHDATPPDHGDDGAAAPPANPASATGGTAPAPAQADPVEGTAQEGAVDSATAPASTRPVLALSEGATGHLVDAAGAAVYYLEGNRDGSRCNADCERAWPPVVATPGQAQAGQGVDGDAISNVPRREGGMQVSYQGQPLYRYAGDQGPGRTSGEGVQDQWGKWHVARPAKQ